MSVQLPPPESCHCLYLNYSDIKQNIAIEQSQKDIINYFQANQL